jgi:hypothetical protein
VWGAVAAAAAVAAAVVGVVVSRDTGSEPTTDRFAAGAGTRPVALLDDRGASVGEIAVTAEGQATIVAIDLPALAPGQAYQLWTVVAARPAVRGPALGAAPAAGFAFAADPAITSAFVTIEPPTVPGSGSTGPGAVPGTGPPPLGPPPQVYYVGPDGLVPVVPVAAPRSAAELAALVARPPADRPDLATAVAAGDVVVVTVDGDRADVLVGAAFGSDTGPDGQRAVAQLVLTLTTAPGVTRVDFVRDGRPVAVPTADGPAVGPFAASDFAGLVAR